MDNQNDQQQNTTTTNQPNPAAVPQDTTATPVASVPESSQAPAQNTSSAEGVGQPIADNSGSANASLQVDGGGKGGKKLLYLAIILAVVIIVFTLIMVGKDFFFKSSQPAPVVTNQQVTPTTAPTPTEEVIQNTSDLDKTLNQLDALDPASAGAGLDENQVDINAISQ